MIDTICRIFGENIFEGRKTKERVDKRLAAYTFLRKKKELKYEEIGRMVGRDHTTIISGVDRFEGLLKNGDRGAMSVWDKLMSGYNDRQDSPGEHK